MKKRKAAAKPAQQPLFAELEYPLETSIDEQLRQAMKDSSLSRYAIAQQSGISQSVLSRFASGERGLTAETAERLAHSLGLRLALVSPVQEMAADVFGQLFTTFKDMPPHDDFEQVILFVLNKLAKRSTFPPYVSLADFRPALAKILAVERKALDAKLLAMRITLSFSILEGRHATTAAEREACLMIDGQPHLLVRVRTDDEMGRIKTAVKRDAVQNIDELYRLLKTEFDTCR